MIIGRPDRIVSRIFAALAIVSACASAAAAPEYDFDRKQLEAIAADLKAWLPGVWDSYPQIHYERTVSMPEEGEHEHWHRTFALIDAPQVGDVVFYGQINLGGRDGPIIARSQVLYKTVIDEQRGVVVITGQSPANAERFENLHERPELWGEVKMRDENAVRCDFIWRRRGAQLFGVLEGKTEERRKYGPGTCTYISSSGLEFYADAEWVLTPDELWLYDVNKMGGVQFIGRRDRTHLRLYRATPYKCVTRDAGARSSTATGHDRGFSMTVRTKDGEELYGVLLRSKYPSDEGFGLNDELRLLLTNPADGTMVAQARAAPGAKRIRLKLENLRIDCHRHDQFKPMTDQG